MNRLQSESSPYLLQHKDNPVDWYPWGDEAFKAARAAGKPIFLSVGYSTCHWCHVMAHESFEDSEVGEVLNRDFISIKVDREERPDVDHVYMQALQVISGGGGWPMSVWLTPEGKPFFAGTYFPKFRLLQVLRRITEIWNTERDKLMADGERLTEAVLQSVGTRIAMDEDGIDETEYEEFLKTYINHFQAHYDDANGGFNAAPKFPQTMNLMVMMRRDRVSGLNQAETMVTTTLSKMLRGGLYDQLNGGFHRYSVDEKWLVPHFEKMLYDQAMIVAAMTDAYQLYGVKEFERGIRGTLDFVLREMKQEEGGFFSAQDADSFNPESHHNEEGYYYTFTYQELNKLLNADELLQLSQVFGVSAPGNFAGRNILFLQEGNEGEALPHPSLLSALAKLREVRAARPAPHLDDKVIASWNGWMIWALVRAGVALKEPKYIAAAQAALGFVKEKMWINGELKHFWRAGEARGTALSEDYTGIIHAALEMYQGDFDPQWAAWALQLQSAFDKKYWDIDEGAYYSNDGSDKYLPMRPKDDYDGVSPGANSMAAYNLSRLFALTGEAKFNHQAERIFLSLFKKLKQYPSGLPFLALALDHHLSGAKVVVMAGSDWVKDVEKSERAKFNPHLLWAKAGPAWPATSDKSDKTDSIYVCEAGRCFKPATSMEEAKTQLA